MSKGQQYGKKKELMIKKKQGNEEEMKITFYMILRRRHPLPLHSHRKFRRTSLVVLLKRQGKHDFMLIISGEKWIIHKKKKKNHDIDGKETFVRCYHYATTKLGKERIYTYTQEF